jgi:threonine/homoserine/homoserine lactone efflux protein
MSYSDAILHGVIIALLIAISVGPTLFAVIRYSMHHSYKAGLAFVVGVSLSDIIYVTLANMASGWLSFLEQHEREVGIIGAFLFMTMGLYAFFKKYKPKKPPRNIQELQISGTTYAKIGLSGFVMNSLNPGVIIYWVTTATLVTGEPWNVRLVLFGTCLGLVLLIDFAKVLLADKIRRHLTLRKIMYLNKVSALIIFALGVGIFLKFYFGFSLNTAS